MRIYVDENDIKRNIITYCNGTNTQQGLYVFGKDKIEVLSLSDYTKQVRKEVCEEIRTFAYDTFKEFGYFDETDLEHILDQIQGEIKNAETK